MNSMIEQKDFNTLISHIETAANTIDLYWRAVNECNRQTVTKGDKDMRLHFRCPFTIENEHLTIEWNPYTNATKLCAFVNCRLQPIRLTKEEQTVLEKTFIDACKRIYGKSPAEIWHEERGKLPEKITLLDSDSIDSFEILDQHMLDHDYNIIFIVSKLSFDVKKALGLDRIDNKSGEDALIQISYNPETTDTQLIINYTTSKLNMWYHVEMTDEQREKLKNHLPEICKRDCEKTLQEIWEEYRVRIAIFKSFRQNAN